MNATFSKTLEDKILQVATLGTQGEVADLNDLITQEVQATVERNDLIELVEIESIVNNAIKLVMEMLSEEAQLGINKAGINNVELTLREISNVRNTVVNAFDHAVDAKNPTSTVVTASPTVTPSTSTTSGGNYSGIIASIRNTRYGTNYNMK